MLTSDNSAITGAIYSLAEDRDGALLVGTEQGVWRYVNNEFTLLHNALAGDSVSSILVDFRGDIWLAPSIKGISLQRVWSGKVGCQCWPTKQSHFIAVKIMNTVFGLAPMGDFFACAKHPLPPSIPHVGSQEIMCVVYLAH